MHIRLWLSLAILLLESYPFSRQAHSINSAFENSSCRRIREAEFSKQLKTYGISYKFQDEDLGAGSTKVHWTIFDPSEGKIQPAIHVQEEVTSGDIVTHTFDFEKGIVWLENTKTGQVLKGDPAVFRSRILPEEHIRRFEEATGRKVVGLTGAGNIAWNDWFVGYLNGQLNSSLRLRNVKN